MENVIIQNLSSKHIWDYENGFMWFSEKRRIAKLIAHYELYKQCISLPGYIAEFGVFKGNSLYQLATFRDMLEQQDARKIYAFDMFGEFPKDRILSDNDLNFIDQFTQEAGNGLTLDEIKTICNLKKFNNIEFIKGNVLDTVKELLEKNTHLKFNFIHIDLDVYEPTKFILDSIYSKIVPGGIIMIDDYNAVEGATKAVDELLNKYPQLKLEKLPYSAFPAFIKKI